MVWLVEEVLAPYINAHFKVVRCAEIANGKDAGGRAWVKAGVAGHESASPSGISEAGVQAYCRLNPMAARNS